MASNKIVFLEHKADVLFEASGSSFEEALENAAKAMFSVIADLKQVKGGEEIVVKEKASSLEDLVAFTLADLLSEADARELFLKEFKVKKMDCDAFALSGIARGSKRTLEAGQTEVKAVTRHELSVKKEKGSWVVRVLLDI